MWFDGIRQPNTIYVANTSRGKDSTAMLRAIQLMDWPLDMIVSVDVWATQDIPAELPPMVAFKDEYDQKVLDWFGVPVTRLCASKRERERESWRMSYEDLFYKPIVRRDGSPGIPGFPMVRGSWCKRLKDCANNRDTFEVDIRGCILSRAQVERESLRVPDEAWKLVYRTEDKRTHTGAKINVVNYLGIAADEPLRIKKHIGKPDKALPLVQIGWDEELCGLEATYMDMLAPTYSSSLRDGCWFCHNQSIGQLRLLRKNYPELWRLLLRWDIDSPVTFNPDGYTVHDFDRRFELEDANLVPMDRRFRWKMLEQFNERNGNEENS